MPLNIDIEFADEENKQELSAAVLEYLENDYNEREEQKHHF